MTWGGAPQPVRGGRADRTRRRRVLLTCFAAALTFCLSAVAGAQDPAQTISDAGQQASDPQSQLADPGQACTEQTLPANNEGLGCDTENTPIAKDGSATGWSQWAGAVHPGAATPDGYETLEDYEHTAQNTESPIPLTVDFYTVSFLNEHLGLAGGARCEQDPPQDLLEIQADPAAEAQRQSDLERYLHGDRATAGCTRVPVIYRYTDSGPNGGIWEQALKGSGPGYVGAITWLHNNDRRAHGEKALAVGGTGRYVRREEDQMPETETIWASGCADLSPDDVGVDPTGRPPSSKSPFNGQYDLGTAHQPNEEAISACEDRWHQEYDPAGMGRAWLFTDQRWREVGDIPSRMRGMTALDASLRSDDCPGPAVRECAMAGGLRQLWTWSDGDFDSTPWEPPIDDHDPNTPDPSTKLLWLSASSNEFPPCSNTWTCGWHYRVRAIRFYLNPSNGTVARAVTAGCCTSSGEPNRSRDRAASLTFHRGVGGWNVPGPPAQSGLAVPTQAREEPNAQMGPDSFYSLGLTPSTFGVNTNCCSELKSPGGPETRGEPPPSIMGNSPVRSVRLVARDGRVAAQPDFGDEAGTDKLGCSSCPPGPGGGLDWAVGGFKTSGRAAAYTTRDPGTLQPYPLTCSINPDDTPPDQVPRKCQQKEGFENETRSNSLFYFSSFFLNGVTIVGDSGVGWAVGDRGAIERLGAQAAALRPEEVPNIGAKQFEAAPSREPYESSQPQPAGTAGLVPALGSQPSEEWPEPRFSAYGAAQEAINQIAMSRDGGEGWAIGPGATTLYHFDGTRWTRCNTDQVDGVFDADPACEALWPLRHAQPRPVRLTAIARVPTEYGSDPTAADEFEVIASSVGVSTSGTNPILRYRDGRWSVDQGATAQVNAGTAGNAVSDIAFSTPDDGWIMSQAGYVVHFDGNDWTRCAQFIPAANAAVGTRHDVTPECRDDGDVFPDGSFSSQDGAHITSAGQRLYMYGARQDVGLSNYPMVLWKDPGTPWQQAYDPGCLTTASGECTASGNDRDKGRLYSLSVALGSDGTYNGWAIGDFNANRVKVPVLAAADVKARASGTPLIRATSDGRSFEPAAVGNAALDYLRERERTKADLGDARQGARVVALPGEEGSGRVFAVAEFGAGGAVGPVVWFDPDTDRWQVLPTPFGKQRRSEGRVALGAMAPDNAGGVWVGAAAAADWFYRFSNFAPRPIFEDAAHPIREEIAAAAGGPDGSFWVATNSSAVYRYDRLTGWDRMIIKNWDRGRVVTNPSDATAIAVGPDGGGLVVGEQGRIAQIGPDGSVLDAVAGIPCSGQEGESCGTGRDLAAAAIAPDGSGAALVGGEARTLLYRSPNGGFAPIAPPPTAIYTGITGISMESSGIAWVTTDTGQIWHGSGGTGGWSWQREDLSELDETLTLDEGRVARPLRAIAVDDSGHGYAVGDRGTIVERTGDGDTPWRRVQVGYLDDLTSVTLGPGGHGVLIGGANGLVLTGSDGRFTPARAADEFDPLNYGGGPDSEAMGLALLPGYGDGQVEAWVAQHVSAFGGRESGDADALLHYSSDPSDALLDGGSEGIQALPDAPKAKPSEVSFSAFGKSDCQGGAAASGSLAGNIVLCPELLGSNSANDVIAKRIRDDLIAEADRPGGSDFALFTGDVGDAGGRNVNDRIDHPGDDSFVHRRWEEFVGLPLLDAGLPIFGALGRRDLSNTQACYDAIRSNCQSTHSARVGSSIAWRQAMAPMPAPWGAAGSPQASSRSGLSFDEVQTGTPRPEPDKQTVEDPTEEIEQPVEDPTEDTDVDDVTVTSPTPAVQDQKIHPHPGDQQVSGGQLGPTTIPTGGARTHYAFDVKRDGQPLLRVAVLDSSLDSLAASDPAQNPTEEQLTWLRAVLFDRTEGERAVVVTNTPTYSYGPGALSDTATDGTALEAILMQAGVDLVVSGRLGWNGVYWTYAPGLHYPCPGGAPVDPNDPDSLPGLPDCSQGGQEQVDQAVSEAQKTIGDTVGGGAGGTRVFPSVVASSAGGKFGPDGNSAGSAAEGFWRGYTNIRLDPTSDAPPVIEQRPVFDWIGITPRSQGEATHVLRANKKLNLLGYGREAAGIDVPFRYDEISSPSITHRFALLEADPDKPWLPKEAPDNGVQNQASAHLGESDPCGPHLCLDPAVGTIDDQSGEVKAGKGNYPRTFSVAQLSVGDQTATYPLVFDPRASFRAPAPAPPLPVAVPAPPPPPAAAPPTSPSVNLPAAPVLPVLTAQALAPPPVPPSPPTFASEAPLDLNISPAALDVTPPTAVSQPPTPPVNPAPPSGARKEARQRQAAAQKSGADSDQESSEAQELGGDTAEAPHGPGHAATRHDFTALADREQPSAWARDALLGGGLGIAALLLALGASTARPTPRRREPELPAPAYARDRRR